MQFNKKFQ